MTDCLLRHSQLFTSKCKASNLCNSGKGLKLYESDMNFFHKSSEINQFDLFYCAQYAENKNGEWGHNESIDTTHTPLGYLFQLCPVLSLARRWRINLKPESRVHQIYQSHQVEEQYYCNFGLNPQYQELINSSGLQVVGFDKNREARILELPKHPFFVATLFVTQLKFFPEQAHRLITAYIETAIKAKSKSKANQTLAH